MSFVPALGFKSLTPLYQTVVDVLCRDDHIKRLVAQSIHGQNMQILDVACGTGKLVKLLAQQQECCSITGVDIDPAMVLKATKKVRDLKNVTVQQGNVTALSFPDSHFDVVIESLVFHHLTDTQKQTAIAEIKRVLKSGGLFYFVDWVKPGNLYGKLAFNIVKVFDGSENLRAHESNEVINMIEKHLKPVGSACYIETSLGTIAIIIYKGM